MAVNDCVAVESGVKSWVHRTEYRMLCQKCLNDTWHAVYYKMEDLWTVLAWPFFELADGVQRVADGEDVPFFEENEK